MEIPVRIFKVKPCPRREEKSDIRSGFTVKLIFVIVLFLNSVFMGLLRIDGVFRLKKMGSPGGAPHYARVKNGWFYQL
jgi:hypothetical protein